MVKMEMVQMATSKKTFTTGTQANGHATAAYEPKSTSPTIFVVPRGGPMGRDIMDTILQTSGPKTGRLYPGIAYVGYDTGTRTLSAYVGRKKIADIKTEEDKHQTMLQHLTKVYSLVMGKSIEPEQLSALSGNITLNIMG